MIGWIVLALALTTCTVGPRASTTEPMTMTAEPRPTMTAVSSDPTSAEPTVAATMPPLALEATTIRDGIEVRLELDRNPLPAGEPTWATVTVRNRSDATVTWMTDGCESVAQVLGILEGEWVAGARHTGLAERFKAFALEPIGHAGQSYLLIGFRDERFVGREGLGCADTGIPHELAAGESLEHRGVWDGSLDGLVPPDGPVAIVATFPRTEGNRMVPVEVRLDSWIVGGKPFDLLTPAAAIDLVLADPQFSAWLHRAPESTWINSTRTLDPEAGTWAIGLFRESPNGFFGMVTVDARTGKVLDHRFE